MAQADIRTAIYNAVAGVAQVGEVHDYARWASTWDAFLDHYRDSVLGQVRGWAVGYAGFEEQDLEFGDSRLRAHRFLVRGVMALEDGEETEKTWATLAESVANAIKDDTTLAANYYRVNPAALLVEERQFGGVLCHYAELAVVVIEYVG